MLIGGWWISDGCHGSAGKGGDVREVELVLNRGQGGSINMIDREGID